MKFAQYRFIDSIQASEGEGFIVNRAFPNKFISDFDPFLLLDEMDPSNLIPVNKSSLTTIDVFQLKTLVNC